MAKVIHPGFIPCGFESPPPNTEARNSLSNLMYEYWVARTWRVNITIQPLEAGNPVGDPIDFNLDWTANVGDETGLVCPTPLTPINDIFSSNSLQSICYSQTLSSYFNAFFSRYAESNDDFLYVNILPDGWTVSGYTNINFGDGHSLVLPYALASQQGAPLENFYETIAGFNIEILDYWSYDGTYDTQTGQRL